MKCMGKIVCLAVMSGLFAAQGVAQPSPGDGQGLGMGRGRARLVEELGLSPEQRRELACATPGQGREQRDAMIQEREKLNQMIRDRGVSDEDIYRQLDKVNQTQANWNTQRIERLLKARKVLDDEQLNRLLDMSARGPGQGLGPPDGTPPNRPRRPMAWR